MTTDEDAMFNQLKLTSPEQGLAFASDSPPPANKFSFISENEEVGTLEWKNGTLTFTGDAGEAAKLFFASVIKVFHTETALRERDLEELRAERDKLRAQMGMVLRRAIPILNAATGAGSWNQGDAMDAYSAARALYDKIEHEEATPDQLAAQVLLDSSGDWMPKRAKKVAVEAYHKATGGCSPVAMMSAWQAALRAIAQEN